MTLIDSILSRLSGIDTASKSSQPPSPTTDDDILPPAPVVSSPALLSIPQPVAIRSRAKKVRQSTYLSDRKAPLLRLSKHDYWTVEDAVCGTHIFGGNGSGKTTGSGQTIAKAFLRAGFGGLVLCAKPDELVNWQNYAKACGRSQHLIVLAEDEPWRFNSPVQLRNATFVC